jgi:hypothetical protein
MPACSSGRSEFYQGRRRRPLAENQTSEASWPRRECPRSGSIGVKDRQSMASPCSRLVTWSYTHLSLYGRRFWRPHPDLDRAATPALPPGGGRPLCGGRLPLLAAALGCFARAPQTTGPGAEPPEAPRSRACAGATGGVRRRHGWRDGRRPQASWLARRAACTGVMAGVRWRGRGRAVARRVACGGRHGRRASARRGACWAGRGAGVGAMGGGCWRDGGCCCVGGPASLRRSSCFTGSVSQIQTEGDPNGWVTNGSYAAAGPLLAEPFMPNSGV